jgi:hypothetical protein
LDSGVPARCGVQHNRFIAASSVVGSYKPVGGMGAIKCYGFLNAMQTAQAKRGIETAAGHNEVMAFSQRLMTPARRSPAL